MSGLTTQSESSRLQISSDLVAAHTILQPCNTHLAPVQLAQCSLPAATGHDRRPPPLPLQTIAYWLQLTACFS